MYLLRGSTDSRKVIFPGPKIYCPKILFSKHAASEPTPFRRQAPGREIGPHFQQRAKFENALIGAQTIGEGKKRKKNGRGKKKKIESGGGGQDFLLRN